MTEEGSGNPAGVDAALAAAGCRALLVLAESARAPDLAHFVGPVHLGRSLVVAVPGAARPWLGVFTDMEREEAAASGLELLDAALLGLVPTSASRSDVDTVATAAEGALRAAGLVPPGPVALAGRFPSGTLLAAGRRLGERGWEIEDGTEVARRIRRLKSAAQLAEARRVAGQVVAALLEVARLLAAAAVRDGELWLAGGRLRVGLLRDAVARLFAGAGLEQPHGNIIAAGPAAAVPHTQGSSEWVLRPGETLVVDLFPRGHLFADCTRTFCVGEVPAAVAAAHRAVGEALRRALGSCRPGASGSELQREVCRGFEAAGYPTTATHPGTRSGYVHGLGHGVGCELHELPTLRDPAGEDSVLRTGDLLTLEPGLYDPEAGFGVRLEDLVIVGPDEVERLTSLPYDLDPRTWPQD